MIGMRTLIALLVAAAVALALAAWSWQTTHARLEVPGVGEPLLPDLATGGAAAARIDIVMDDGEERITLVRRGDAWFAGEAGYPADPAKIRKFLLELVKLRKAEPKTRLRRHYRILEVEDPGGSPQARGVRVTIRDAAKRVIADVILGKPAYDRLGAGRQAQYARLAGEARSWLVEGLVRPLPALTRWVDHVAVDIPREKVVRGRIAHADGEVLEVRATDRRGADGEPLFEIVGLPAGAKTKPNYQIASVARDLAQLDFELARKARAHDGPPVVRAEVETKDGLVVGYDVYREDNALWVRVRVLREGAVKKTAEAIRRETRGWEYGLSVSRGGYFLKRLSDLVEAEETPAEALPEAAGQGGAATPAPPGTSRPPASAGRSGDVPAGATGGDGAATAGEGTGASDGNAGAADPTEGR